MQNTFGQAGSRSFNPMLASKLSEEARRAVNEVFDAMSTWRTETVNSSEKNGEQVIEKMAAAARALGWPEQIVDATRLQMQSITKMQIQTMDQVMDAWEEQIRSPNPMAGSSAMMSKLKSLPGLGPAGSWPNAGDLQAAAMTHRAKMKRSGAVHRHQTACRPCPRTPSHRSRFSATAAPPASRTAWGSWPPPGGRLHSASCRPG